MSEEPTLREHLARIARSGGASRSERKRAAAKRNLKRAWAGRVWKRRYPGLPLPPASGGQP